MRKHSVHSIYIIHYIPSALLMAGSDSPTFFHGQPWSNWIEKIGRDKPLSDDEPEDEPASSVTRLSVEDIDLYGFCPERDTFYGVVCEICNAIVKPQALIQHMETRHPSGTVNLPPPTTPVTKSPIKTPYCKLSKLKKSLSSPQVQINHSSIKKAVDQACLQSSISLSAPHSPLESLPVQSSFSVAIASSSPNKSPSTSGQPRRKRLKPDRSLLKDREYDPDKHCGVWNDDSGKPCTRSLTCKAHTVSLRRTVSGRSKTFDKLLAEHRAAKELPTRPTKVTVIGTVTVSSDATNLSSLTPKTPISMTESGAPSSPPVLSLPDTYPLPQAVDLLYRCLAPHGSTKPTKLEEDFANEELRLEPTLANSANNANSIMTPLSVILPSLSPKPANNEESSVSMLIPVTHSPSVTVGTALLPATQQIVTVALDTEAPVDVDSTFAPKYSPVSVFTDKSQLLVQLSRSGSLIQPSVSKSYQTQASMPILNIFESTEHIDLQSNQVTNGKKAHNHTSFTSPISRQMKRNKHDFAQEFSTAIQVEATTTSTPYPHFEDISWSNCHPEPLAVSRWLRITSSRKQYNFNIH